MKEKERQDHENRVVLRRIISIMETHEDWSADTLDEIGALLLEHGYACPDGDMFRSSGKI